MEVKLICFIFGQLEAGECLECVLIELLQDLRIFYVRCPEASHVHTSGHPVLLGCPTVQVGEVGIVHKIPDCILDIDKACGENLRF